MGLLLLLLLLLLEMLSVLVPMLPILLEIDDAGMSRKSEKKTGTCVSHAIECCV